jgi:hypothetical protein
MYYIFQHKEEMDSMVFFDHCESIEQLDDKVENAELEVLFVYDDSTRTISRSNGYYDNEQASLIIKGLLTPNS